jgi:hypothetical protein
VSARDRLAVMADEARALLLALGCDDVRDGDVAGAISDADAELAAAVTGDGAMVRALRRRRETLIRAHEYHAQTQRALRVLAGETT